MVIKVATAIDPMAFADPHPEDQYPAEVARRETRRQQAIGTAITAIKALIHPITDGMRRAGLREVHHGSKPDVILWAMLTAALDETGD